MKILSLDISSKSTGWCYTVHRRMYNFGTIKPEEGLDICEKLLIFKDGLLTIAKKYKPEYAVIEDSFFKANISTLKVLAKFAGVAQECLFRETGVIPHIMSNKTTKAHFEVKDKQALYDLVAEKLKWDDNFTYKTHNDISDAYAQAICFYEKILKGGDTIGK